MPLRPFGVWSAFHFLGLFSIRDYALLFIWKNGKRVNRTCILPKCFRFPFMGAGDLQIAGLWTDAEHQGQGLGRKGVEEALRCFSGGDRVFWYLVREDNLASIRLAESLGFQLWGTGERRPRLGIWSLGGFHLSLGGSRNTGAPAPKRLG